MNAPAANSTSPVVWFFVAFGLIVAVDLLPHLQSPNAVVDWAARHLEPEGTLVASVPPIVDERIMEQHKASGLHRMSLYLWNWESLFRRRFQEAFGETPTRLIERMRVERARDWLAHSAHSIEKSSPSKVNGPDGAVSSKG